MEQNSTRQRAKVRRGTREMEVKTTLKAGTME